MGLNLTRGAGLVLLEIHLYTLGLMTPKRRLSASILHCQVIPVTSLLLLRVGFNYTHLYIYALVHNQNERNN